MRHSGIKANGIHIHYVEQGEGPLVLLCHGFPETWYSWRHQISALAAAGYRVVAPDLRGYGESGRPDRIEDYALLHVVADMVHLLDALGEKEAVIIGNDWGSTLAWQAALLRPDRFHKVACGGVPFMARAPFAPSNVFPQNETELLYTLYFQEEGLAEKELERDIRMTLLKIMYAASGDAGSRKEGDNTPNPFGMVSRVSGLLGPLPEPAVLPPWLNASDLDIFTESFQRSGFRGGLNYYRNLDRNWEQQAAFDGLKVTVPALFMVGERDTGLSIPGMQEIIADMPRFVPLLKESIVLPDVGHWLGQEAPEQVNAAILAFLD